MKDNLELDANFSNLNIDLYKNACKFNNGSCYETVMADVEIALGEVEKSLIDYQTQADEVLATIAQKMQEEAEAAAAAERARKAEEAGLEQQ